MAYLINPPPPSHKHRKRTQWHWVVIVGILTIIGTGIVSLMSGITSQTTNNQPATSPATTIPSVPVILTEIPTSTPEAIVIRITAIPSPGAVPADDQASAILSLLNIDRARNGLQPIKSNPLLTLAAEVHSTDMARGDFISHTGSDETDPFDRVDRTGYQWLSIGENVLQRWDIDAQGAYQQWWNSPPHQENMMTAQFTEIGIAYQVAASGRVYYTMVLGNPAR